MLQVKYSCSAGEGALQALGGSSIGFGTDQGKMHGPRDDWNVTYDRSYFPRRLGTDTSGFLWALLYQTFIWKSIVQERIK